METTLRVAKRFEAFLQDWEYRQYLLIGGYGSGKSYHIATKIITKLLEEKRTALVVRQVRETIKESCFSLFKEILENMNMLSDTTSNRVAKDGKVVATVSPMEIRFPNGSRIIFRGMDNPEKIKSINNVSLVWIEECSEISKAAYLELLGRMRVKDLTLHIIMSCNPIGRDNWVFDTFFTHIDDEGNEHVICDEKRLYQKRTLVVNGVYYHHSVPDDNPFLQKGYIRTLDDIKTYDPYLWTCARWGRFGANGTRVLPQFVIANDAKKFKDTVTNIPTKFHFFGLDFGFETSYNALISCAVDDTNKYLYIYDELYRNKITDDRFIKMDKFKQVAERANEKCDKPICADSAEPKTIQFYRQNGVKMYGCKKYIGSRLANTKKLKRFRKIICSPKCKNAIRELKDLTYAKDSKGNLIYDEFNIDPHCFSALWYALDTYTVADIKELKTNSRAG